MGLAVALSPAATGRRVTNSVFIMNLNFRARGKSLVIDLASTAVEVCEIVFASEILEIYFPSGRVIHCRPYPE